MRPDGRRARGASAEWWCRLTLRGLAVAFVIVGAQFLFLPDATVHTMNAAGAWIGDFTPLPTSTARFWLTLATGYMALVAALAYVAQRNLRQHRDLLLFLALGKATTALSGLGFYLYSTNAFLYLANFVVDGSITLVVVAVWAAVPSFTPPPALRPLAARSAPRRPSSNSTFESLVEAMIPSGGPFEEGAAGKAVAEDIEAFVAGAGPLATRALRVGLWLFDASPFVMPPFRLRRFSRLALEERVKILEAWEGSRLLLRRQGVHLLKLLVMTHFYSRPEIEARLGYPHPLARVPRVVEDAS